MKSISVAMSGVLLGIFTVVACNDDLRTIDDDHQIAETTSPMIESECCVDCIDTSACVSCNSSCTIVDYDFVTCENTGETHHCPAPCPALSVFIPNVITVNGDGYNDTWTVMDANMAAGPIYAASYKLSIYNQWGGSVNSSIGSKSPSYYYGGEIFWNGRINNTGALVSAGIYYYGLTLYNCHGISTYYKGWIYVSY